MDYPTQEHKEAAEAIVEHLSNWPEIEAILLTCSCARGRATRDSCLDVAALVLPGISRQQMDSVQKRWDKCCTSERVFQDLRQVGAYSLAEVEFCDGVFDPSGHDWTSGPDTFELAIGNILVYSVPQWERSDYLSTLQRSWLPYYPEHLRQQRLEMVLRYCQNNLDHIPLYIERRLYFQSFHRLWNAFGEFLQALFISRRTYPIAYDKWIKEQVAEILGLPELYAQLPRLFEIAAFESRDILRKAEQLRSLVDRYVPSV